MANKKKNPAAETTTVPVFIPKTDKNDDALFVAVNGRRMLIRKGEVVEVPPAFAEVIAHSVQAGQEAERFINAVANE
ncbi:MAG: hypothetical protein IKJ63_00770 [Clostridia bacterium]|nr:hypothetical protein [Clostridia bacterium]MBR3953989.1 hypothetical protein [Clostridia bacterium]